MFVTILPSFWKLIGTYCWEIAAQNIWCLWSEKSFSLVYSQMLPHSIIFNNQKTWQVSMWRWHVCVLACYSFCIFSYRKGIFLLLVQRIHCLFGVCLFSICCYSLLVCLHCSIFVSKWQRWPQTWRPLDFWSAMQPRLWMQGSPRWEHSAAWLNCRLLKSASAFVMMQCSFMEAMATLRIILCSNICETAECIKY